MGLLSGKSREREGRDAWEQALKDKQERLVELRDENLALKRQIEAYQAMEKEIAGALVEAKAQALRMAEASRAQAEEELSRARAEALRIRRQAAQQEQALEQWQKEARAIAGEALERVQPILQSVKALGQEKEL